MISISCHRTAQDNFLTYHIRHVYHGGVWQIEEHRRVEKQLDGTPLDILKRYEKWKDIAIISGPPGLRLIKGFHDEALRGEWQGYRSSRLGAKYRVIYRVVHGQSLFQVVHITPHEYRRV
jgi:addiction module RelE/StbE family toxin